MLSDRAEPTVAERVRTVCARARTPRLVGDGVAPIACPVFHLFADGSIVVTVPDGAVPGAVPDGAGPGAVPDGAGPGAVPAVLELLDYAPRAAGASVRALVWARGRISAVPAHRVRATLDAVAATAPDPALLDVGHGHRLLTLGVEAIVFADATGAENISLPEVLDARPDPFCRAESDWVRHLDEHHPDLVQRLRLHLPRPVRRGPVRLIGLDRYGLQVEVSGPEGARETRVPFFAPVSDEAGLRRALRLLIGCPFSNALRSRPSAH